MSEFKINKKLATMNKINDIISVSKLKVLDKISKIKRSSIHSLQIATLSIEVFKIANIMYGFESEIYKNNFNTKKNINIVFLEQKMTLSNSFERTLSLFKKNKRKNDLNLVVCDFDIDIPELNGSTFLKSSDIANVSYEIIFRYVSKKYERVNVFSSISEEFITILPMSEFKMENNLIKKISVSTNFYPSIEKIIEQSFIDYVSSLLKYFYINGKYYELKNTLLKHESSIESLDKKIDELKKDINKMRQSKITEEILLSFREVRDD
ncbi:MAG: F0F1 ATP synthase subunit gamma [Mycoplasmatales bacterium]|nr:F0F1 ATP synthase subunit gamma [Mycoplasmatales bacterium]